MCLARGGVLGFALGDSNGVAGAFLGGIDHRRVQPHHLLHKHVQEKEKLAADREVTPNMDLVEQEVLHGSYRSAHKICLARWQYNQRVVQWWLPPRITMTRVRPMTWCS
ncbi:hypothetical protein D1007_51630 [Hordeum vulgare]|nr:hypothetical protein D1007_51630 [Hordeum vulgare]